MKDDKKKENGRESKSVNFVQLAVEQRVPPLYNTREINGIIVKWYPFIRGNSKIYNQSLPDKKINQKDYSLLAAYKNELENQIELNRKNCIEQYNHIILATKNWLNQKFDQIGRPVDVCLSDRSRSDLVSFALTINTFIQWVMVGVETENIKKRFSKDSLYESKIEIIPIHQDNPVIFDLNELMEQGEQPLETIERVVSRSVDLYFEYVNIHSHLYGFDPNSLFTEKDIYYSILDAPEGELNGKIAFVQYIRDKFNYRSDRLALKKANKIHTNLRGKKIYSSKNSFDVSKSKADEKKVYKILNHVK